MSIIEGISRLLRLRDVFGVPSDGDAPVWNAANSRFQFEPAGSGGSSNLTKYFDAYDALGGIGVTVPTTLNLDTVRQNGDVTVYSLASDEVTISESGTYMFNFRATIGADATDDYDIWLEHDVGAGFVEVPGTHARITTQ